MAKSADIFIYGDVVGYQGKDATDFGAVSLRSVVEQIQNAKDADTLNVHIHSNGGEVDEGFAIHDALMNSGKTVNTIVDGNCYSIATVIFLAGTTRRMSANSQFMIHNPWGMAIGTGEEIQKYADGVKAAEQRILDFYVQKTGGDSEQIKSMMDQETFMSADQAIELKFATEIVEPVKAYAKVKIKSTHTEMSTIKDKVITAALAAVKSLEGAIKNLAGEETATETTTENTIQASTVKTQEGAELNIEMAGEKPAVGDSVKAADGADYSGTATLEDGTTITCEAGKITSVSEAKKEESEDAKALAEKEQEINNLKSQLEEQKQAIEKLTASVEEGTKTITALKKVTSKDVVINSAAPAFNQVEEKKGKTKEEIKAEVQASRERVNAKAGK